MFGLKIVTEKQVSFWKYIENDYDAKCHQLRNHINEKEDKQRFFQTLVSKLEGTGAAIHAIKQNKKGIDTYVCVIDRRSPEVDCRTNDAYMSGDVDLFVLNEDIYPSRIAMKYNDVPYLQAEFHGTDVKICELHSDVDGERYENCGYGTMLVEALIAIAKKSGCNYVHGMLSNVDAQTEDAKNKRNGFYRKRGFTLKFCDEEEKDGGLSMTL